MGIQYTQPVRVALEPVSNALNSFSLLHKATSLTGLNTWVSQTWQQLTTEQQLRNRVIFEGMRDALTPDRDEPNFPSYLHNLSELNAYALCQRIVESLRRRFSRQMLSAPPQTKYLLEDVETYLNTVKWVQGEADIDSELHTQVHALLQQPEALQQLIVEHLELLWKGFFLTEWRRIQSSLSWQVEMFGRALDEAAPVEDIFYTLTGRILLPDLRDRLENAREIILIPSWHTGRHVFLWDGATWDGDEWGGKDSVRLFFSEPPNYDVVALNASPVGRAELRARCDALADETRLRIIELLTQQNEMSAQEIIAALELSQSSVSRHLKTLVSLGYLYERRSEGANKTYRLSSFYFERTAQAIRHLIATEAVATQAHHGHEEVLSQELRRFLDRSGRLTTWPPARQKDKLVILEYLASFFEYGKTYSEKEVNEILTEHSTFRDSAALRRALHEFRFMNRKRDGSLYWLIGPTDVPQEAI